jgi:hypothetical protein
LVNIDDLPVYEQAVAGSELTATAIDTGTIDEWP